MKKLVLIMTVTVLSLIPPRSMFSNQEDKEKIISCGNSVILVKFEKDVDDGKRYCLKRADLQSRHIRKILKHYDVKKIVAVYRNRYSRDGKLIPNKKYADATSTFRYIMINDSTRAKELVYLLQKEKSVLLAAPESPITITYFVEPDDTAYGSQWYLNSAINPSADIDAEQAWNINVGRNDVIIAVCDGGVDYTHDDLDPGDRSRIIAGYDTGSGDNDPMDDLPDHTSLSYAGHGTSVAGIIGAITDNNNDISGIMWNCKIMPVKMVGSGTIKFPFAGTVVDFSTTALPGDVADAIDFAVNNDANVINLSYGFKDLGWPIGDIILRWPHVYEAILNAYNNNVVVVAAMGNEYTDGNPVEYPAGFDLEVIAVGNTNEALQRSSTSNTGQHIDLAAPGSSILTTKRGGGTVTSGGTSMSAPIVSGISGLLISQGKDRNMNLTNDDIRHILEITADDITPPGFDEETGYGKVNAYNALSLIDEPNTLVHGTSIGGQSVYQATLNWVYIGQRWNLASGVYYGVKRYQITKHIEFDVPFCSAPSVWIRERESISISAANPNRGYPWAEITNITQTGFDVKYFAFFIQYNLLGQTINKWIPSQPAETKIEYTAIGVLNNAASAGPITGPSIVCSPGVFTVQNLPPGCSITWNPGPYLTMSSQQGSNPCTFTANGSGASWVETTITDSLCGSTTLPKFYVQVNPVYNFISTEFDKDCSTVTLATNLPSYTSVTWNASSNFLIDGYYPPLSKQGNSIIVTSTDGNGGSVYGTTSLGCSITPYTTFCPCQSWSGASITWIWACPSPGEPLIAEVSPLHTDATEYKWYIGDQLIETTYDGYLQTYNWPCTSEMPHLYVTGVTSCGHTELIDGGEFFPACGGYKSSSNVILYPNPASSVVTIAIEEKQSPVILISSEIQINTLSEITQIKLIDKTGMTRKLMNFGKNTTKVSLQLSEFQSGVYYLDVTDGARHVIKPLTIKK